MKVLHVLSSNKYSGAENVVCQIIDMFKNDVEMAYCSPDGDIRKTLEDKNVEFFPISKLSVKEIKRVIEDFKPDVIHAHDLRAICVVAMLSTKIKKVGHIHVNDKTKMSKLSLKSAMLRFASKKFSHLFWVSNSCFEDYKFKKALNEKSSVLYNIINVDNLKTLASQDKKNYDYDIIYLGRLTYQKNPERLIEIGKKLKQKKDNFKMAIVGGGDLLDNVKQLIVDEKLENNIVCLGFMKNAYKLLSDTKLMLMTSRFEGTPMCALEALSLGVPLVSTKTDGMVDLISHGGNGFLYDTNDQAVDCVLKLIEDENIHREMKSNCVKFSKDYNNLESYKQKIKKVYEE